MTLRLDARRFIYDAVRGRVEAGDKGEVAMFALQWVQRELNDEITAARTELAEELEGYDEALVAEQLAKFDRMRP